MNNPDEQNAISYQVIQDTMSMPDAYFDNPTFENDILQFKKTIKAFSEVFHDYFDVLLTTNFRFDNTYIYFDDLMVIDEVLHALPHHTYEFEESPYGKGNLVADMADILEIIIIHYNDELEQATITEAIKRAESMDNES